MALDEMSGGAGYDIEIWNTLFVQAKLAEASFNNDFKTSYEAMERAFNQMKNDSQFSGKMRDGFIEVFEILIQYHKDIVDTMPDFYKAFDTLETNLQGIKQEYLYQKLEE